MASSLDDTIPQWKKDLILRKRLGGSAAGVTATATIASHATTAVSCLPAARQERCESNVSVPVSVVTNNSDNSKSTTGNAKMVQDSVMVIMPPATAAATNGDCCKDISDSDSSEELQYGPGIVSKLKSKYLSLTLRESSSAASTPRPSILPLRRAASLEQLLDGDEAPITTASVPRRYTPRVPAPPTPRYRPTTRRNESVKRARSVETVSRGGDSSSNKQQPSEAKAPRRPLRVAPLVAQAERPPADHVKQTMRLFEGPAARRTRPPPATGDVAAKVASFKQIIDINTGPPVPPPLPLSPKPALPPKPVTEPSPIPDVLDAAAGLCPTPDLIVHSSPRPLSPRALQTFLQAEITHTQQTYAPSKPEKPSVKPQSPIITSPPRAPPSRSPSPRIPHPDPPIALPTSREVTQQAIDNIAKAGHTITYHFSDPLSNKSHLPRLNSIPVRIKLVPDTGSSPPPLKPIIPPPVVPRLPQKVLNGSRPTQQPPKAPLTSREIEKNSINKLKTLEQPVSKVVVAMRSVDEVVAKKTKPRGIPPPPETTILFNFSARESIPDYIATDGSQNVRRGKREKPKPGESGIILLPGAPAEEFADDDEDWMLSLNGPPSPCDVHFVNDNILIDGKSSIRKQPKRQKMRIQFDDEATQVFEYLSEASMMEDMIPPTLPVTSPPPTGNSMPSLTGSSLASYTPSKMSVTADFQLGVTRQPAVVTTAPQSSATENLDLLTAVPADHPITYSAETTSDILF